MKARLKVKALVGLILFGFGLVFVVPSNVASAEALITKEFQVPVKAGIFVDTNAEGIVKFVQVQRPGTYLTRNEILVLFDSDADGKATLDEFNSRKDSVDWTSYIVRQPSIILGAGFDSSSIKTLFRYMNSCKKYVSLLNFHFYPPQKIYLETGRGSYSTPTEWHLDRVDLETVSSKVIQGSIIYEFDKLGYTAMEAFSRYFIFDFMRFPSSKISGIYRYNTNFEGLTGDDIARAYDDYYAGRIILAQLNQIIRNVGNNNLALSQAMLEIKDNVGNRLLSNDIVLAALELLKAVNEPNGPAVLNAFLSADNNITGGRYNGVIRDKFANHGVYS